MDMDLFEESVSEEEFDFVRNIWEKKGGKYLVEWSSSETSWMSEADIVQYEGGQKAVIKFIHER